MNENAEVIKNRTESGRVMRRLSNCSGNMMETCLLERFAEGKAIYLLLFPLPDSRLRIYPGCVYAILRKMLYNG